MRLNSILIRKIEYPYKAKSLCWSGTWAKTGAFSWRVARDKFCSRFSIRCAFCPCGLPLFRLRDFASYRKTPKNPIDVKKLTCTPTDRMGSTWPAITYSFVTRSRNCTSSRVRVFFTVSCNTESWKNGNLSSTFRELKKATKKTTYMPRGTAKSANYAEQYDGPVVVARLVRFIRAYHPYR